MPVIVPKTLKQCQEAHAALLTQLVDQWWDCAVKTCAGGFGRPYLVGTRGKDSHNCAIWASVRVANWEHTTGDEVCIRSEQLPVNATRERMYAILDEWLAREPIFTFAD